jgi:hypothetical protein
MSLLTIFNKGIEKNKAVVFLFPNIPVAVEKSFHILTLKNDVSGFGYILYNDSNNNLNFYKITKITKNNYKFSNYIFYHNDVINYDYNVINKKEGRIQKIYIADKAYTGRNFFRRKNNQIVKQINQITPFKNFNSNQNNSEEFPLSGSGQVLTIYLKNLYTDKFYYVFKLEFNNGRWKIYDINYREINIDVNVSLNVINNQNNTLFIDLHNTSHILKNIDGKITIHNLQPSRPTPPRPLTPPLTPP